METGLRRLVTPRPTLLLENKFLYPIIRFLLQEQNKSSVFRLKSRLDISDMENGDCRRPNP